MALDFLVERKHIHNTKFVVRTDDPIVEEGQILCRVDHFAFTANNITYASSGEFLKYWQFFPVAEEGWGRVPVWGFADVVQSRHADIGVGERLYGYWPMSTHLVLQPVHIKGHSFMDGAAHRQQLSPIYNTYMRVTDDPAYAAEALNALLRPMFTTSFLLDDWADDNNFFGAETMLLSSASSKTGYGTAFLLHRNRAERAHNYRIIGLTSPQNVDFVASLGCYDAVYTYADVAQLPLTAALYFDFAGNGALRQTIHEQYGDQLQYDCAIGATNWDKMGSAKAVSEPKPQLFFAPAQLQKRLGEWGSATYNQKMNAAWAAFLEQAAAWVDVVSQSGSEAVQAVYESLLTGTAEPHKGFMLSLESREE